MKKIHFLLSLLVFSFVFQSCKTDDEDNDKAWREANEAAFSQISTNPAYVAATTPQGPGAIYYKTIKSGQGTEHPLFTAQVKVLYKGSYYNGSAFDSGTSISQIPVSFKVNQVVRGFDIALQNMVIGDRWEVWIPWDLGYGTAGSKDPNTGKTTIPGYTTLVFDIELVGITQYP